VLENPAVLSEIVSWWGEDVRLPDGSPNRSRIGELVFTDGERKRRLESLLYPLIAERRRNIISEVNSQPAIKAIVLDSPLLFESALDRLCDVILFVDAPRPDRLARVQSSRGWDDAELARREAWQKTLEFKRSQSHFVIDNSGTLDELRMRVDAVLTRVLREWREGDRASDRG
jgi:dephospho-CoA kinase